MTTPVIELENMTVRFGTRTILDNLNGVFEGRATGLLGPNGAGKTTLIHTLLGFHPPSNGTARVLGFDLRTAIKQARARIGYMPERDAFVHGETCIRFVTMMAELAGLPAAAALERAHEALFYVGLGEARYRTLDTYSLGMKQLAKLAQAIVHAPRVLFLDEPTNGLDPPARVRMLELIREIRDRGDTHIVLSSHLLRDVEACCDRVLILKHGAIAAHLDLEAERKANLRFFELELRGAVKGFTDELDKRSCDYAFAGSRHAAHASEARLRLVLPDHLEVKDLYHLAAQQQIQIRRLAHKRDSLEDIFMKAMES